MDIITEDGEFVEITIEERSVDSPIEGAHEKVITLTTPDKEVVSFAAAFVDNGLYRIALPEDPEETFEVDLVPLLHVYGILRWQSA